MHVTYEVAGERDGIGGRENVFARVLHEERGCSKLLLRPSFSRPPFGGRRGERAVFFGLLTSTPVTRSDCRTDTGPSRPDSQDCSGQRGREVRTGRRGYSARP